jgi:DNA polymerase III epsilon subunit-like protein
MTTFIEKPNRRRVMVFDVETTGLLPKNRAGVPLSDFPHILQISFVIFDTQYWRVVKSVDLYINVPSTVEISEKITELTGITREKCDQGTTIANAMLEFQKEYMLCNMIVAHNIQFDRDMIRVEMARQGESQTFDTSLIFNNEFEKTSCKELYCTMHMGRKICNLERKTKEGRAYLKSPKLIELYEQLFGMSPQDLHNSLVDTYVCLRCFVKLRFKFDLSLELFPNIQFRPIALPAT